MPKARVLPNPPHERHLLPIPLPHGRSGTTGSLTVFFAPRLRHRGPLWHYQEWADWPDTVNNNMSIQVFVNGVSRPFTKVTPLADSAAWRAVFADVTPVSGHRATDWRTLARDALLVGPGGDFSEAILRLYAAFATSYPEGPPEGDEATAAAEAGVLTGPGAEAARRYVAPMADDERPRIDEPPRPGVGLPRVRQPARQPSPTAAHPRHRRRTRGRPSGGPRHCSGPHRLRQRHASAGGRVRDAHDIGLLGCPEPHEGAHRTGSRLSTPRRSGSVLVDRRRGVECRPAPRPREAVA